MDFTFKAYERMVRELSDLGYKTAAYDNCDEFEKCVILRHDIDLSVEKALEFAVIEKSIGVKDATYFFLLTSDLYNISSRKNKSDILKIAEMGFKIGLHFDEKTYPINADICPLVQNEAKIMSNILELEIKSVSMHRPSEITQRSDHEFNGLVNAYSKKFFNDYKYLSDSRMHWREDVHEAIHSGKYKKFQILTHPFWYYEEDRAMKDIILSFVASANKERYENYYENFRSLEEILPREEIL